MTDLGVGVGWIRSGLMLVLVFGYIWRCTSGDGLVCSAYLKLPENSLLGCGVDGRWTALTVAFPNIVTPLVVDRLMQKILPFLPGLVLVRTGIVSACDRDIVSGGKISRLDEVMQLSLVSVALLEADYRTAKGRSPGATAIAKAVTVRLLVGLLMAMLLTQHTGKLGLILTTTVLESDRGFSAVLLSGVFRPMWNRLRFLRRPLVMTGTRIAPRILLLVNLRCASMVLQLVGVAVALLRADIRIDIGLVPLLSWIMAILRRGRFL